MAPHLQVTDIIGGFAPIEDKPGEAWLAELNAALNAAYCADNGGLISDVLRCIVGSSVGDAAAGVAVETLNSGHRTIYPKSMFSRLRKSGVHFWVTCGAHAESTFRNSISRVYGPVYTPTAIFHTR